MNNADFWASIRAIINEGFTAEGLQQLDIYATEFISRRLVYKRFSPHEQYGCAAGGMANVVATLLAGAEVGSDSEHQAALDDFKAERQSAARQEIAIEQWSKRVKLWTERVDDTLPQTLGAQIAEGGEAKVYDHGTTLIKSIGLDYFIQPIFALDRISLHNTYFPETKLTVLGFGRDCDGEFKIIVEQPFVAGIPVTEAQIAEFMRRMGFELRNARNWTWARPDIYLSDLHDENVIGSKSSGTIFVVDCDIRINHPGLRQGGTRELTTEVVFP